MPIDIEAIYATRRTYIERILSLNLQLTDIESEDLFDYFDERGQFTIVPAGRVVSYIHPRTGKRVSYTYKEDRYYLKKAKYFGEIVTYTPRAYEVHLSGKVEILTGICPKCGGSLKLSHNRYTCQKCGNRIEDKDRKFAWKPLGTAKSPIFFEIIFDKFHSYLDEFELKNTFEMLISSIADHHIAGMWKKVNWRNMRFVERDFGIASYADVRVLIGSVSDWYDAILFWDTPDNSIVKESDTFSHEVI